MKLKAVQAKLTLQSSQKPLSTLLTVTKPVEAIAPEQESQEKQNFHTIGQTKKS